jgi:hypothetical protein
MGVQQQHAVVLQRPLARRAQPEPVADAEAPFVRTGDDVEQPHQVVDGARHRADHREVRLARQRRGTRRHLAARGHEAVRGLERRDTAEVCRHTQRAADVRAQRQRAEPGRECRR